MSSNAWLQHSDALAQAYVRAAGTVRFELVTRALQIHLRPGRQSILDLGGGYGEQAIRLARLGHEVTIFDCDPAMLAVAAKLCSALEAPIAARIRFLCGDGAAALPFDEASWDLVCCHSVLMYQENPVPMLRNLAASVRPGGLISILAMNSNALAMRSGLQRRWLEASALLECGTAIDSGSSPSYDHDVGDLLAFLNQGGLRVEETYGVGIFTDHLMEPVGSQDCAVICQAEWLAGRTDPYRQIARCFHIIVRREESA